MERFAYIGSAGVAGGGTASGSLGTIKWFEATASVPAGWSPADGGGLNSKTHKTLLASMNVDGFSFSPGLSSLYGWRSNAYLSVYSKKFVEIIGAYYIYAMGYSASGQVTQFYRKMLNRNWNGAEADLGFVEIPEQARAWGYVPEDDKIYVLGNGKIWSFSPLDSNSTPTQLTATNVTWSTNFPDTQAQLIKIGSKYIASGQTSLLVCEGAGAWGTWASVSPAGMAFPLNSALVADIGGVKTAVIVDKAAYVWTSTDGVVFTKLPLVLPGSQSSENFKPMILEWDGVDTFWYLNMQTSIGLYRSADLQTWVLDSAVGVGGSQDAPVTMSAKDGLVMVGYSRGPSSLPVVRYSPDKGVTWITTLVGNAHTYAWYPVTNCAISGAGLVAFQYYNTTPALTLAELAQKKPMYRPVLRDGVTMRAFMKVM